jgi:cell fate (sporulation/competence/biofilm development) regulator YlbF (YheA/YmcA/DUF963 family)
VQRQTLVAKRFTTAASLQQTIVKNEQMSQASTARQALQTVLTGSIQAAIAEDADLLAVSHVCRPVLKTMVVETKRAPLLAS